MTSIRTGLALVGLAAALFTAWALIHIQAWAHDGYEDWRMPDHPESSCCNNADCRPTRAFTDSDGNWHAWNGSTWLEVPKAKLLPTDLKHDGRSHLCELNGHVYCFSPAEPKS